MTRPIEILLQSLGIDPADYEHFLISALSQQLVFSLAQDRAWITALRKQPDGMKRFRSMLEKRTGRKWSSHDLEQLYDHSLQLAEKNFRKPIEYEDIIRLLFNTKHECAKCHKGPPEVILHIDHIMPSSKGGPSTYRNLQFLCSTHNLQKSDIIEHDKTLCLNFE